MEAFEDSNDALGDMFPQYDIGDPVELAVATYRNLGLLADEERARHAFSQAIGDLRHELPRSVVDQPHDIVMVTKLGELSLRDLISRYDKLTSQKGNPRTWVWDSLWDKYTADEFNQGQTDPIVAQAVLLGRENDYDEAGLYFINCNLKDQRESLKEAQKEHSSEQVTASSLSLAGYIISNVMRMERGEQLMDRKTLTRFIGLGSKSVYGGSYVPLAHSNRDGPMDLYGSDGYASPIAGVRLAVGLK